MNTRATTSFRPPGGHGTTKRTGLAGQSCAAVNAGIIAANSASRMRFML
ncbi:MAG: hypothetical protein ACREQZ_00675 [Woeseiaceae bacterium]